MNQEDVRFAKDDGKKQVTKTRQRFQFLHVDQVKQVLTQAPVLKFFDPQKKTVLQCDASMSGLGACLMQEEHPVAYVSRAVTLTETNYAQIEKELQ